LLFALIIIAMVYMALDRVSIIRNNAFALWTVTIASAVLSVRFIATEGLVKVLLLPHGVFGVAMLTMIPLLVWFWFVEFGITSNTLRKIAWIVFGVVFVVLWWKQYYILGVDKSFNHLYLISAIVALIVLFADGTIQKAIRGAQRSQAEQQHHDILVNRLLLEIRKSEEEWITAPTEAGKKALEKKLEELRRRVKRVK